MTRNEGQPDILVTLTGVAADSASKPSAALSDPTRLLLHPLDVGITRGDGIFEAIGVNGGHPLELEAHLERLQRSARMLDLPPLRLDAIDAGVRLAIEQHTSVPELLVKVFVTRGPEASGEPTAWIHASEGPDYSRARSEGIAAVTLNRGYPRDIALTAPWLLQGAKTLSYAVNRSALREAALRGAQDAIFLSTDGFVLEGPASTVILRDARGFRTPPPEDGVLPGTTQVRIFRELEAQGFATVTEHIREEELRAAAAVWLVSSGRLVVPVRILDGAAVPLDCKVTDMMLDILTSVTNS
ncbi:aminotransferase class IV [Arthrobacter sp. MW3 TE3886]|uniref:aminotransferase class IV n=1 Tax=Arthrobacter sp. MW3 TE3886 TaxID=3156254 RepID=UPI003512C2FC